MQMCEIVVRACVNFMRANAARTRVMLFLHPKPVGWLGALVLQFID